MIIKNINSEMSTKQMYNSIINDQKKPRQTYPIVVITWEDFVYQSFIL